MTRIIEHEFYYVLEVVECRYRYYVIMCSSLLLFFQIWKIALATLAIKV